MLFDFSDPHALYNILTPSLPTTTDSDCNNILLFFKGAVDCLCIRHSCCCAVMTPDKGLGLTTDETRGEFCKIGLFCCDLGLILPTKLCGCASQCLCYYSVANFPCSNEYIPAPVCTCLPFCQCFPRFGCCVTPPPCPALDKVLNDQPIAFIMVDHGAPNTSSVTITETVNPDGSKVIKTSTVNPDGSTTVQQTSMAPGAAPALSSAPVSGSMLDTKK
jgi:hypothetical protein